MSEQSPTAAPQRLQPSASYSFTMRLHIAQQGNAFARVAAAIADAQALLCSRTCDSIVVSGT